VFEVRPSSNADEFGRSVYAIAQYFGGPLDEEPRVWNDYAVPLEPRGQTRFVTPAEAATLFPPVRR
jgi:hypothetical protein